MKALEFYSGIGGLHYALSACDPTAEVTAFDINDLANSVYEHNFGAPPVAVNIGNLTAKQLDKWAADAWLLSPPCQPYTRRGLKKQSADARATSFLTVLDLIPQLKHPPKYLLVENVVGFETSDTRQALAETLGAAGYQLQEFIVTPTQLGIPYSRPRYFALAKRGGAFLLPTPSDGEGPMQQPPSRLLAVRQAAQRAQAQAQQGLSSSSSRIEWQQQQQEEEAGPAAGAEGGSSCCGPLGGVRPLGDFLVKDPSPELEGGVRAKLPNFVGFKRAAATGGFEVAVEATPLAAGCAAGSTASGGPVAALTIGAGAAGDAAGAAAETELPGEYQQQHHQQQEQQQGSGVWAAFRVPEDVIRKHGYCFDLVSAGSTTSNCFTKTYGQYIKGSGSLIATENLHVLSQLEEQEAATAAGQRGELGEEGEREDGQGGITGEGRLGANGACPPAQAAGAAVVGSEERAGAAAAAAAEAARAAPEAAGGPGTSSGRGGEQGSGSRDIAVLFESLKQLGLRYFTPREIANLHSFPPTFNFPPSVTLRQRYSLLGNSLSVAVVADLLAYMFLEPEPEGPGAGAVIA